MKINVKITSDCGGSVLEYTEYWDGVSKDYLDLLTTRILGFYKLKNHDIYYDTVDGTEPL